MYGVLQSVARRRPALAIAHRSIAAVATTQRQHQRWTPQAPRLQGMRARGLASEAAAADGEKGEDAPKPARVWMWGQGTEGQLGHYPFEKSGITNSYQELSPRELRLGEGEGHNVLGFVELAAGLNHTAGVTADGKLYTWGDGANHKLGHGDIKPTLKPKLVEALKDVHIVKAACGDFHTAAIDSEGRLYTWGWGGSLWGGIGGLGHGDEKEQSRPKLVKSLLDYGCRVASVACGEKHTLILTDDGEVLTCGNGEYGRLGNGGSSDHPTPEPVEFFDESTDVVQIASGHAFNLVLTSEGKVFTWGRNEQGQLGLGGGISMDVYSMEALPLIIEALQDTKIKAIAAGHSHSAAISESGELFMWGMKLYLEPQLFKCSPGEGQAPEKVAMVACGGSMTAAVAESGRLYTFGKGGSLCLGRGNKSYSPHPQLVEGLGGRRVLKLGCGHKHMGVLTD